MARTKQTARLSSGSQTKTLQKKPINKGMPADDGTPVKRKNRRRFREPGYGVVMRKDKDGKERAVRRSATAIAHNNMTHYQKNAQSLMAQNRMQKLVRESNRAMQLHYNSTPDGEEPRKMTIAEAAWPLYQAIYEHISYRLISRAGENMRTTRGGWKLMEADVRAASHAISPSWCGPLPDISEKAHAVPDADSE